MLEKILRKIEKIIPTKIYKAAQPIYHFGLAILGIFIYKFPAKKIRIIAVTGTKGKTSTVNFIHSVLNQKEKTGLISTANIKIGNEEFVNKYHMSTPGRFILHGFIKRMKDAGCKNVVIEVSSEGIKQFRHLCLPIDISVFTNLSPEHLASHGNSFEKYRSTKMRIFSKNIFNRLKLVLVNSDDENAKFFLSKAKGLETIKYSLDNVKDIKERENGLSFVFDDKNFNLNVIGKFNIYNALPAIILGERFGVSYDNIKKGLENLNLIPGRMEEIKLGQSFKVIVDYAHEKLSINNLLDTAEKLKKNSDNKIIVILGGDGGGRDEQRLFDMGEAVGKKADIVIVSNSDPYFDDEIVLANKIANEAGKFGKVKDKNLFVIIDRAEAIKKAVSLGIDGDVVLLATRGSLTTMNIKGKNIPSDDRVLAKEALLNLKNN